jgi:hypothetical protein
MLAISRLALFLPCVVLFACGRSVEESDGSGGSGAGHSSGTLSAGTGTASTASGTLSSGTISSGSISNGTGVGGGPQGSSGPGGTSTGGPGSTSNVGTGVTTGGFTTGVTTGTGVMTCPGLGDVCTNCMSNGCADVWCGCAQNPECLPVFNCWEMCGANDQACVQNCMVQHQGGVSAALLVSDCAATACDSSCNWGQSVPPCTQCLYSDCSTVMNACFADAECIPLLNCLNTCSPQSIQCQSQCYADHQSGIDPLQAVIDCSNTACSTVCN